jgi:hypothetical protein
MVVAEGSSKGKDLQNSSDGHSFGVSPKKGVVTSSYTEVVHGAAGSLVKISAMSLPKAEMRKLDLLSVMMFRDEEDMRVAVNCFDLEEKLSGFMEKKQQVQSHGSSKVRKMKLEYPRLWKKLLGLLRSNLDRVSVIMAEFFVLGLKPKLSLGVRSAWVGFKPILKKARGFVAVGREPTFVDLESGLVRVRFRIRVWF